MCFFVVGDRSMWVCIGLVIFRSYIFNIFWGVGEGKLEYDI